MVSRFAHILLATTQSHGHTELQGMLGNAVERYIPEAKAAALGEHPVVSARVGSGTWVAATSRRALRLKHSSQEAEDS